jgi:hypothetical protein
MTRAEGKIVLVNSYLINDKDKLSKTLKIFSGRIATSKDKPNWLKESHDSHIIYTEITMPSYHKSITKMKKEFGTAKGDIVLL